MVRNFKMLHHISKILFSRCYSEIFQHPIDYENKDCLITCANYVLGFNYLLVQVPRVV